MRSWWPMALRCILILTCAIAANPAASLVLELDPSASTIDGAPASGSIRVEVGAPLPVPSPTAMEITSADVTAGGYAFELDPGLSNPGLGVIQPNGDFFIPTLFLAVDDGVLMSLLAVPDVFGSLRAGGDNCAYTYCLETSFSVTTQNGVIDVTLSAIPEPGTALLLGVGLVTLARSRRNQEIGR